MVISPDPVKTFGNEQQNTSIDIGYIYRMIHQAWPPSFFYRIHLKSAVFKYAEIKKYKHESLL